MSVGCVHRSLMGHEAHLDPFGEVAHVSNHLATGDAVVTKRLYRLA